MNNNQQSKPDRKGFAIASFVLGIISIIPTLSLFITFWFRTSLPPLPFVGFLGIIPPYITGIIGFILGMFGLKSSKRNFAIAGMVLSIISFLFYLLFFVILSIGGIGR